MPAVLSEELFLEPEVPEAWEPVLKDLRAFVELEAELRGRGGEPDVEQLQALSAVHDRLVSSSAALLEPKALEDVEPETIHRLFARSLLFLIRLKESVLGPEDAAGAAGCVLDTAGSRTLALYEADYYHTPENLRLLRGVLTERLAVPPEQIAAIEAEVERDLGDARRKQALVRALRQEFGLMPARQDLRHAVHRLFRALFPAAPLEPGEVELVLTGTLLFFCIPFAGEELTTERFRSLDAPGREPIAHFLKSINAFAQERFGHFPAFGHLRREQLDPQLIGRLAARAGLAPEEAALELCRVVTILPLAEIDKYLVHDVWGHGWQASMLRFEDLYAEMAGYDRPFGLVERALSRAGGGLAFGECFRGSGSSLVLDEERFRRFAGGELAERLPIAMSAVLAEMMADVAEYKLLSRPEGGDLLPSSSFFRLLPSKLDLTLQDVKFYFTQATKALRLWVKEPSRRRSLRDVLLAAGAPAASDEAAAEAAVDQTVSLWKSLAAGYYRPALWWEPGGEGKLRTNAFTRLALNFVGIHRAILETYRQAEALRPRGLPLKSCKDLLIIAASVFFEADPPRNLWRVDEYLSLQFLPLCRRLGV